jgi:hypothetical protein
MSTKLVTINVDVMKQRVAEARESIKEAAKARKDQALVGILNKGIELSKKQLSALESARKAVG